MSNYPTEFLQNKLLVKGDFSGIQEFIFNTKSKGAAKTLKGKSFYIQILAELAIECIFTNTGITSDEELHTVYNGGGNFYLLIPQDKKKQLLNAEKRIHQDLRDEGIMLIISSIVYDPLMSYGENLQLLNAYAQEKALNRFQNLDENTFVKLFGAKQINLSTEDSWKKSADSLLNKTNNTYQKEKFGEKFQISEHLEMKENVNFQVPRWNDELIKKYKNSDNRYYNFLPSEEQNDVTKDKIITYSWLGEFANERTGTASLGILKIDLDNLGQIVRNKIKKIDDSKKLSIFLNDFFDKKIKELIETESFTINGYTEQYKNCLGIIFSGGDDSFLIGSWDAVFFFSILLKNKFDEYFKNITKLFPQIIEPLTYSAGLVFVPTTFPVSSFSNLAEEALEKAKGFPNKNALYVLDNVIDWQQWQDIEENTKKIIYNIQYNHVPKSILSRLKRTLDVYDTVNSQKFQMTTLTRLIYELKAETGNQEFTNLLKETYQKYLKCALLNSNKKNALLILPISARIAEFATRKKINDYGKRNETQQSSRFKNYSDDKKIR